MKLRIPLLMMLLIILTTQMMWSDQSENLRTETKVYLTESELDSIISEIDLLEKELEALEAKTNEEIEIASKEAVKQAVAPLLGTIEAQMVEISDLRLKVESHKWTTLWVGVGAGVVGVAIGIIIRSIIK